MTVGEEIIPRNIAQLVTVPAPQYAAGKGLTAVSLLLDLGVPPHVGREIVGHSDIEVTVDVYAHASMEEKTRGAQAARERDRLALM
jgi:hypothetical protein